MGLFLLFCQWSMFCYCCCDVFVTVNESQMEIPAERGQDLVWHVEQRNKKTYLEFDAGKNRENVEY